MSDSVAQKFKNLSPEKMELLRKKLQQRQSLQKKQERIPKRKNQSVYPISAAQKRLWFLDQLDSGSAFYNIPSALRISGELDIAAMEGAVNDLVARHEILRSFYTIGDGGEPVQKIHPKLFIPLTVIDLSETPAQELDNQIKKYLSDIAATPFNLADAPLLSATLLDLPKNEFILMLNMHHIIADGWSIGIILQEILAFYAAREKNLSSSLPEPKLQFADYAQWQQDRVSTELLNDQLEYWQEYLQGMPPALEIITDYPRPSVQSHRGKQFKFTLEPAVAEKLAQLSKKRNVSLFNTLMAAVQLFFYKYTQQQDFGIGAPIANRHRREVEEIVGFFVNTIVLRARFDKDVSFLQLLDRVKNDILEATAHQDIPFERIVEEVMPQRDLSRSPLFQVMFDLQKAPFKSLKISNAELKIFDIEINVAKFDLLFLVMDVEGEFQCTLEYNTELFKESTIERMAAYFSTLLEHIAENPEHPISELPLLTPEEQRRILLEWNDTTTDYPRKKTVQELFEKQAAERPNSPAVKYGRVLLTYSELNKRANKIAHYLKIHNVAPGDYIALYLERSPDMIASILGILKAGACYVPLDLAYPKERLAFMVEDVKAPVLITQRALVDAVPAGEHEILVLDAEQQKIAEQSGENPKIETTRTSPAYVIYTSGSTGKPKGVVVPHRAIVRLVINTNYIELGENDCIAQVSNAAFDAATFEIWGALLNGGKLVGISKDVMLSSQDFAERLRQEHISAMFLTVAYFNQMVREVPGAFTSVNTVMFGGEAADVEAVRLALQNDPPNQLLNVYGPTENTTFSTWYKVESLAEKATNVPIGKPIANSYHYVLDKYFKPCPVGVPGELYLGGDGLSLGYHNRSDLNAQKFIPDPFRTNKGARLYCTGDLVRYLPDGNVEFLGRIDQQVKIRGFRIELGEIESLLKKNEKLDDAVVVAWENKLGEKQIVAYTVSAAGVDVSTNDLKSYLSDKLPEYMIPTFFVSIDAIPINANGKIDKRALPNPTEALASRESEYIAPRNELEKYLVHIWQELLGVEPVGVYDNFFDLGGNSLKAAMFMNKMQKEFGATTHVAAVFKAPRIAEMAVYMAEYYPDIVGKMFGHDILNKASERIRLSEQDVKEKLNDDHVATFRRIIRPLPPRSTPARSQKNPKAVFLLSPPRSGSTLLRVMLAGNGRLFAPPELDLLSFNTLQERKNAFSGNGLEIWLQATVRAIMEIKNCDADQAARLMAEFEEQNMPVKDFYWQLQQWLGGRMLVDKTPTYPFDMDILKRAEEDFDDAMYIHLVRHPYAMIYSFIEAKLDQNFFRYEHPFSRRELAELIWIVSNQNILKFLEKVPQDRHALIRFEDLLHNPQQELQRLCDFLGVEFQAEMLEPYKGKKMTDGIKKNVQMVGDFKFYLHKNIDSDVAEKWKKFHKVDFLSDAAWELANHFHYPEEKNLAQQLRAVGPEKLGRIRKIPRTKELPLSFAQQRLWFLEQFDPGNIQYNIPVAVRLKGPLKLDALEKILNKIVERHETLRTVFNTRQDGKAEQIIKSGVKIPLPVVHLDDLPREIGNEQAKKIADAEAALPFDLSRGPLLRAKLMQFDSEEFVLIIVMHHIASDGWSVNIFIRELAALYEATSRQEEIKLPELPVQYADFAAWQRNWLSGPRLESQLSYWKKTLGDGPAVLDLPTDRPRSATRDHKSHEEIFQFSKELTAAIKATSQKNGVTVFMTLIAAWQVLMARYANQTDVAVGTPIAGRTRKEIEPLIGFFVNTLVLRSDLSDNPTFSELLVQVKEKALGAYDNQDVPFEKLVDELQPNRDMNHTPLFQTMFALQESALETIKLTDLTLSVFRASSGAAKFDLSMSMVERYGELRGQLESDAGLFDPSTIKRLISHFENLLQSIVKDPEQHVLNVPIQSEEEQYKILRDWNRKKEPMPSGVMLHQFFEKQVEQTPDAVAVSDGMTKFSYHELNERANQLAHYLREHGVGPDEFVGISLGRTVQAIVAILAVWKAGGAYVPLDPDYPVERLGYIFQDSDLKYLITQKDVANRLPLGDQQVFMMDVDWPSLRDYSVENPGNIAHSENLAYIIYTSGSTGKPKGVMIPHHSAYNLLLGLEMQIYHRLPQQPLKTSLNAPLLFDASVQQLVTLLRGHQLCMIPAEVRTDGEALLGFIRKEKIDVLDCVPSQLKLLIDAGLFEADEWTPQALLPGGEAIDESMWRILQSQQNSRVFNMYGPTECTVDATSCMVTSGPDKLSIGRPLANAQVFILDRFQQPVPIGVVGEICIAGEGLSRGYLNRAELTAEKFIPNPFSSTGSRLYRTGDVGRFLPDGDIEYSGRLDHQVKLRGYRMELGEIEANLNRHDRVKETVVVVREDQPGDKRLVAYFIAAGEKPTAPELREFLKPMLPEYMIPSYFVALEKFSLTPNGKLDRAALPKPQLERRDIGSEYSEAQSKAEKSLTQIWQTVLGVDNIGVDDNFFELGGDSILSIQVIARAQQKGILLTPRQIFDSPTIRDLAVQAGKAPIIHAEQGLVAGDVLLTPIQKWFFEQDIPNRNHWNQSLLLEVSEALEPDILEKVTAKIIEHHDVLRLRFQQIDGEWRQHIAPVDDAAPFKWLDFSSMQASKAAQALKQNIEEQQKSLDISAGPIFQIAYYKLPGETDRLFIVIHHLAVDGLSWRILLEDIGNLYKALSDGATPELPSKTTSFKYWAERLYDYAASEQAQAAATVWEGMQKESAFPVDFNNGPNTEASAKMVSISLSELDTFSLLHEVNAAYQTVINDILLTALAKAFAGWSGNKSLLVDLEGHGRESIIEDANISRTVGWFTTLYPVQLDLSGQTSPAEEIKAVKQQLSAIPRNGIDFGVLKYLTAGDGKMTAAAPRPQIAFNYLGQFHQAVQDARFRVAAEEINGERDANAIRPHELFISGKIMDEKLHLSFMFSTNLHKRETIESLANHYVQQLREIINHCRDAKHAFISTKVDPQIVDEDDLDGLLEELE